MPPKQNYNIGDTIGDSTFLKEVEPQITPSGRIHRRAEVTCHCGGSFEANITSIKAGRSTQCEICRYESVKEKNTKHGESLTRLYKIWKGMKQRCLNKKSDSYSDYGGRGITVCYEWLNSYEQFQEWANNNGYSSTLTIDRRNSNGNYEPSNCRWADKHTQACNTRKLCKTNKSGYRGVSWNQALSKWESSIQVNYKTIKVGYYTDLITAAEAYDTYVITNKLEHTRNFNGTK